MLTTIRYLGIHLTKEVKDLYSESYETTMKEIEDDTKKWKDIPCSWMGRTNIFKMSVLPKVTDTFNAISIKISRTFFTELEQTILNFIWNYKRPRIATAIFKKKPEAGGITILDFKLYYKAVVIKTGWGWHKHRHTDYWNRIQNPEMYPQLFGQLISSTKQERIAIGK